MYNYLNPIVEPHFIHDSYSCRTGKGTLEGIRRCEHHIRSCTHNWTRPAYALQLDIQGYFMSINKEKLYELIMEKIDSCKHRPELDYSFMDFLIRSILFRDPVEDCLVIGSESDWDGYPAGKSLRLSRRPGIGLPIGDLTSQLFSNIYLNPLDHYIKRTLRCKHYGRYVDDFFIIHQDRHYLARLVPLISAYLQEHLSLRLHPGKIRITSVNQGIKFLGCIIKPFRRYVSNRTVKSFHSCMNYWVSRCRSRSLSRPEAVMLVQIINSYTGYFSHFRTFRLLQRQFARSPVLLYVLFTGGFRRCELRDRSRQIIPFRNDLPFLMAP